MRPIIMIHVIYTSDQTKSIYQFNRIRHGDFQVAAKADPSTETQINIRAFRYFQSLSITNASLLWDECFRHPFGLIEKTESSLRAINYSEHTQFGWLFSSHRLNWLDQENQAAWLAIYLYSSRFHPITDANAHPMTIIWATHVKPPEWPQKNRINLFLNQKSVINCTVDLKPIHSSQSQVYLNRLHCEWSVSAFLTLAQIAHLLPGSDIHK